MTKFAVVPVINKNFNHAIPYTYASKSYLKSVTPVIGRFKFFKCLWPYDLTQFKVTCVIILHCENVYICLFFTLIFTQYCPPLKEVYIQLKIIN